MKKLKTNVIYCHLTTMLIFVLCNNQIHAAGAQAIAHALIKNTTVEHLDLRLNRLGDEGGQAIG